MSVYANPSGQANVDYRLNRYRWQDWINLVLGIWLFITPWIWGPGLARPITTAANPAYTATAPTYRTAPGVTPSATATAPNAAYTAAPAAAYGASMSSEWNAWIVGAIFFLVALCAMFAFTGGTEWVNVLAAIWLFISPWVLGFAAGGAAAWNAWVVGVIVFLVALSATQQTRTTRIPGTAPPAGV
jgi:hypothetical protein